MAKFLISYFLLLSSFPVFATGSDAYPSYDQVLGWIEKFSTENRTLVTKEFMGFSTQSRPIWLLRLSTDRSAAKPLVFFNAAHHGDEVVSTEVVMSFAEYLVQNVSQESIQRILKNFDLLIQPVVNPDGYNSRTRNNADGIDLNRDYPLPGQVDRRFFQAKETRLLNKVFQERDIFASVSIHSGTEAVLWPLCYTREKPSENEIFSWLAKRSAKAMDISRSLQSFYDYPSYGEQIDHAYLNYGTLALTFEISEKMAPEKTELPYVNNRAIKGSMQFLSDLSTLVETH
jgi:murein tripeptide amidase MpaA